MNITKSVAVLVSLGLLVIAGFALTNLMLTCQPTTSAIEPTPQTLQSTAQTLPLGPKVTSVDSSIPGAHVLSAQFVGGAYRMGVNLGSQEIGGPGDFMQNMLDNPGFEPPTDGHLIKVGSGATTSTFSDTTDSGAPTGYWIGRRLRLGQARLPAASLRSPPLRRQVRTHSAVVSTPQGDQLVVPPLPVVSV